MRGADISQNALFVTVTAEDFVPLDRDRPLAHDVVGELFEAVVEMARTRGLLSDEHFSVDRTLIRAWASHQIRPKDEGPGSTGRNEERDFRGEERKNDTHHQEIEE